MGKTLSIETGITCSNRCTFCYQLGWRTGELRLPDPSFEALEGKLKWGIDNGYDQVGFSGGEPTIRKDFLALVRRARELGYDRVSLTTNGRRFANEEFAREALEAGIDSIGWSLHGPDAETHDPLVGREGAFAQVVRGLGNVQRVAARLDRRVDQNLFVLVNRQNHDRLSDICRVGRRFGIRLMILQPVIYSKGNLAMAATHAIPLPDLVRAVARAAGDGLREEWFVKLFNLPPCFFTDRLEGFEHQRYPVSVFRYQERQRAGETKVVAGQGFLRLDRCRDCLLLEHCPGLHQSLVPQPELRRIIEETLRLPDGGTDAWIAGLELLEPQTLTELLAGLRRRLPGLHLRVHYAGDSVAGSAFVPAIVAGGAESLVLAYSGLERSQTELSARSGGNAALLRTALASPLVDSPTALKSILAIPYVASASPEEWAAVYRFARDGVKRLQIQLPWDFKNPEIFELFKFVRLARRWRQHGGESFEVAVPATNRQGTPFFRIPMLLAGTLHVADEHYAPHFFSGPRAGWVSGATPVFARRPAEEPDDPTLANLPGDPITPTHLDRMRPG